MYSTAPKIKICGLTSLADARAAAEAGANYLGFIIDVPSSPRTMSPGNVKEIIAIIKKEFPAVRCVGVLVNESLAQAQKIIKHTGIDVVQLHGSESPEYCVALHSSAEVWKALIIKTVADLALISQYRSVADKVLFDAGQGSGQMIDFNVLKNTPVDILAGGLTLSNIAFAIEKIKPAIVDCNSGVEKFPGIKDVNLIKAAIAAVRNCHFDRREKSLS